MPQRPRIAFWFDYSSLYSYPALMRVEAAAAARGVEVDWRPFLLGPVFRQIGWDGLPLFVHRAKGEYTWRDIERRCRLHGLPFLRPPVFPLPSLRPLRVATLGVGKPWLGEFSRRVMRAGFAEGRAIDSDEVLRPILSDLGLHADALLAAAATDAARDSLRSRTAKACARGIFGAPTLFAGDEMFWGDDRLEDAIAWAVEGAVRIHHDRPDHLPDFVRLVEAWIGATWGMEPADNALSRDPQRILRNGGSILSLARGDRVLGVCALFREGPDRFQLARMTVAAHERGKGYGEQLLVAALGRAREMGAASVYLLTNTALGPAVHLYRKHGFRTVREGPHPEYARCNLVMERRIEPADEDGASVTRPAGAGD